MVRDGMFYDAQSQSCTTGGPRARRIYSVESFKDAFSLFIGNPGALIPDSYVDHVFVLGDLDPTFEPSANMSPHCLLGCGWRSSADHNLHTPKTVLAVDCGWRYRETMLLYALGRWRLIKPNVKGFGLTMSRPCSRDSEINPEPMRIVTQINRESFGKCRTSGSSAASSIASANRLITHRGFQLMDTFATKS